MNVDWMTSVIKVVDYYFDHFVVIEDHGMCIHAVG